MKILKDKRTWIVLLLLGLAAVGLVGFQLKAQGADFCYAEVSCGETSVSCQVDGPECTAERGDDWVKCFGTKSDGTRGTVKAECPETK